MRHLATTSVLAVLALSPCVALAQVTPTTMVQPLTPDADALAEAMRMLATNPNDVATLVRAGELALKLGDQTAAGSLFARAQKVDPANPRVKAGMARILLRNERPGEALRYFDEAEGGGVDPVLFASDRGLAYDLTGQQDRAQRDYRSALRLQPGDDEAIQRYALSLAISGRRDEAIRQLTPLLQRQDRSAWRAEAFVLALTGDTAGAQKIASSMLPQQMAAGLTPFFARIRSLSPVDQAFAVTFGDLQSTPQRLADARLAPSLRALPPEAGVAKPPVALASATPTRGDRNNRRRRRNTPAPVETPVRSVATTATPSPSITVQSGSRTAPPVAVAALPPRSTAPAPVSGTPTNPLAGQALTTPRGWVTQPATNTALAQVDTRNYDRGLQQAGGGVTAAASSTNMASRDAVPVTGSPAASVASSGAAAGEAPASAALPRPGFSALPATSPTQTVQRVAAAPVAASTAAPSVAAAQVGAATAERSSDAQAVRSTSSPEPADGRVVVASTVEAAKPVTVPERSSGTGASAPIRASRADADDVLAKVMAGITIPGSELGVAPAEPQVAAVPAPRPSEPPVADAPRREVKLAAAETRTGRSRYKAEPAEAPSPKASADEKDATGKRSGKDATTRSRTAADGKTSTDTRSKSAKTGADEAAKPAKDKAAAKKDSKAKDKKPKAEPEPARVWVQVAGGARESDLPKAWSAVKAKAPEVFRGKQGWSTPLRATNRVLAGPFKSQDEAQDFVNALAKKDVSAFTFTSDAGQKIEKLPTK